MDESFAGKTFSTHAHCWSFKICHWKPEDAGSEANSTVPSPLFSACLKLLQSDGYWCVVDTPSTHTQETPESAVNESLSTIPELSVSDTLGVEDPTKQTLSEVYISS